MFSMDRLLTQYRFVIPVLFLTILALLGLFAEEIANPNGFIPFGPETVSPISEIFSPPGVEERIDGSINKHYLGTDHIGRDVAARIIHGIPIAFKVGIYSSLIALLIALVLGFVSGYIGNFRHKVGFDKIVIAFVAIVLIHFYAGEYSFNANTDGEFSFQTESYFVKMLLGFLVLFIFLRYIPNISNRIIHFPWDTIILKLIEVFKSIPRLFLLLAVFAIIVRPSVLWVIVIIGMIRWPALTRVIRAEILVLKEQNFLRSSELLGLPTLRLFMFHILPNIYKPIMVLTAFNMGNAILIESSLSFLHIGLPTDAVSWGRMLGDSRNYIPAWWMALVPGLLIFCMVLSFNMIGDSLSRNFDALSQENLNRV